MTDKSEIDRLLHDGIITAAQASAADRWFADWMRCNKAKMAVPSSDNEGEKAFMRWRNGQRRIPHNDRGVAVAVVLRDEKARDVASLLRALDILVGHYANHNEIAVVVTPVSKEQNRISASLNMIADIIGHNSDILKQHSTEISELKKLVEKSNEPTPLADYDGHITHHRVGELYRIPGFLLKFSEGIGFIEKPLPGGKGKPRLYKESEIRKLYDSLRKSGWTRS